MIRAKEFDDSCDFESDEENVSVNRSYREKDVLVEIKRSNTNVAKKEVSSLER